MVYIGVNNQSTNISKIYVGVNNQARPVSKIYIGVNNQAKLCYSSNSSISFADWETYVDTVTDAYGNYYGRIYQLSGINANLGINSNGQLTFQVPQGRIKHSGENYTYKFCFGMSNPISIKNLSQITINGHMSLGGTYGRYILCLTSTKVVNAGWNPYGGETYATKVSPWGENESATCPIINYIVTANGTTDCSISTTFELNTTAHQYLDKDSLYYIAIAAVNLSKYDETENTPGQDVTFTFDPIECS